ncbi:MAG: 4-hydroxy-tetrahydrodipicolinate reductase [bacterium]|jgi:4-hydroxy-tetrahydrodipicolinate reductase|nr:4-hydroxy-tetrahydrodipicolinate reductase [bacterium]
MLLGPETSLFGPFTFGVDMTRVAVCGIAGRMGGRIGHLTMEADDLELSGGVEYVGSPVIGKDVGQVIGVQNLGVHVVDDLDTIVSNLDVVVAFTAPPDGTLEAARIAGAAGVPMVIGSTGMSPGQIKAMTASLKDVACVFAPNFSVGVTVLVKLVEEAARILGDDYDGEIVEAHHRFKTDAPSGTALALAEAAARGFARNLQEVGVYGRHGNTGARTREEIGIHAVRAGDIVGEHTVMFGGIGETVQLVHRAQSRDTFAAGVIRAVRFAVKAGPGMYDMRHVLGLE